MRCSNLLSLVVPLFLVVACSRDNSPREVAAADTVTEPEASTSIVPDSTVPPDGSNSRDAVDWAGTYSGVLPCASCPGIDTLITLNGDGTYTRSMLYIGESPVPESDSGRFAWNDAGSTVTLTPSDGATAAESRQYKVGENQLFHLDQNGERITGNLAGRYVLQKHLNDPAIENKRWRLVELRGQPVAPGQAQRDGELTLRPEDAMAAGNASCNTFSGTYAIKSGQRISFARNMAVTMMACPDMSLESEFLDVLKQADNYSVGEDGTMSLYRARMAPLARFEEAFP